MHRRPPGWNSEAVRKADPEMSEFKRSDIQKRFEARMDVIFGGRMCDDETLATEEDSETVSDHFLKD